MRGAFTCSVHTHSIFCDGKHTMAEMAAAAFDAGVRHFGVSGHAHTPAPSDVGVCMAADTAPYRAEALRLREEYRGRMEVLLGIEWDLCADQGVPDWADYWIGSVHNLHDPAAGDYYAVDWKAEELERCRDARFGGDMPAVVNWYYEAVAAVAAMKPTILGHIDLITKLNGGNRLFDEDCPAYRDAALAALHAADPQSTLLEINTGAMARGYRTAPYPARFLLREWRAMGGRIILTADAHSADGILFGYREAADWAKAANFERSTILTLDGPVEQAL